MTSHIWSLVVAASLLLVAPRGLEAKDFSPLTGEELNVAVQEANGNGEADTIHLTEGTTYAVGAELQVSESPPLTIEGYGATLEPAAESEGRVFFVHQGAHLILRGVIVRNFSGPPRGGAIASFGTLDIEDAVFQNNWAKRMGGAIFVGEGNATIRRSTFANNMAPGDVGVEGFGGAIYVGSFGSDAATAPPATVVIEQSTFYQNTSLRGGGAIRVHKPGTATVRATTFYTNASPFGGALSNEQGTLVIYFTTIAKNTGTFPGIFSSPTATTTMMGSIVTDNTFTDPSGVITERNCEGIIADFSNLNSNLVGEGNPCKKTATTNYTATSASSLKLGTFVPNMVPGQGFIPLQAGSVAIDKMPVPPPAHPLLVNFLEQLNLPTKSSDNMPPKRDIGAVEHGYLTTPEQLIAAVQAANTNPDPTTIALPERVGFTFQQPYAGEANSTALPAITTPVTITGLGTVVTRDPAAAEKFRLLFVETTGLLTLDGITVQGGETPAASHGGGLFNRGRSHLTDTTWKNNVGTKGGAIFSEQGSLTVETSDFLNSTASKGGAITIQDTGPCIIQNSRFIGNKAASAGGAIAVSNSSCSIVRSTIANNSAGIGGSGIQHYSGSLQIYNSTVSSNQGEADGGGIVAQNGQVDLYHTTVTNNMSITGGGGLLTKTNGKIALYNSFVADNRVNTAQNDCFGNVSASAYNIVGAVNASECTVTIEGEGALQQGTPSEPLDPKLGPLQLNGHDMETHWPFAGSPVRDAGDPAICVAVAANSALDKDQLGRARDGVCDLGAVELHGACGDGAVNTATEACDDGNTNDNDGCALNCTVESGWQCNEDGELNSSCSESCGDGKIVGNEFCDDGNSLEGDYCDSKCEEATGACGDGIVQNLVETCDDGNDNNGDACLNTCQAAACGDGDLHADVEACDDGLDNADTGACTSSCAIAVCGDSLVRQGTEICDDGNTASGDGCSGDCQKLEFCGDGKPDAGEGCDLGAENSDTGACTIACKAAACGDGLLQTGVEACDDGAKNSPSGSCDLFCELVVAKPPAKDDAPGPEGTEPAPGDGDETGDSTAAKPTDSAENPATGNAGAEGAVIGGETTSPLPTAPPATSSGSGGGCSLQPY